jgi:hypothetical protein
VLNEEERIWLALQEDVQPAPQVEILRDTLAVSCTTLDATADKDDQFYKKTKCVLDRLKKVCR